MGFIWDRTFISTRRAVALSGYPDSDDKNSNNITAYRYDDDEARMYRDAGDPVNLRPTCLVALGNDPLDPRLWIAEIRTVGNIVGMYNPSDCDGL